MLRKKLILMIVFATFGGSVYSQSCGLTCFEGFNDVWGDDGDCPSNIECIGPNGEKFGDPCNSIQDTTLTGQCDLPTCTLTCDEGFEDTWGDGGECPEDYHCEGPNGEIWGQPCNTITNPDPINGTCESDN